MSQPLFASLFDETQRRPLTVSELTESVRKAIEARFSAVWVEGEISNFKAHSSGHWYFTIKDEGAQLRAKCFRSANSRIRFRPKDGLHVRARGRLTVYEARGDYELIVEGEISNFKAHSSGHWYFTIKDEGAQLRAKCFRSANSRIRFRPKDGLHVRARGRLTVYEARGDYELIVEALDPVGAGALQIAFEQLRDRLQAEGLFSRELKRPLPVFPGRVGVVTSPTGAAIRDILNVISRRTRTVHVLFSPARVQGDGAGSDIARAIKLLNDYHQHARVQGRERDLIDVLIVGRGGGSTEDLWAFNTEEVARAIRASAIPVISAVGHETDFTIADFVADQRAPTPSAAAELVAAREDQLCNTLAQAGQSLAQLMRFKIMTARTRVQEQALSQAFDQVRGKLRDAAARTNSAGHRIEILIAQAVRSARLRNEALSVSLAPAQLRARVAEARVRFDSAYTSCNIALEKQLEDAKNRLGLAATSLDALSPLAVLQRGYSLAQTKDGKLISDGKQVSVGDSITVRLAKGSLGARVESVNEK